MIVRPANRPRVGRSFDAHVVWLHERPLDPQKSYFLKHTTQSVRMQVQAVHSRTNLKTLERAAASTLQLNEIGLLSITTHRPLFFDAYEDNRGTGAFVIVDSLSNATVGAGMIVKGDKSDGEQDLEDVRRSCVQARDSRTRPKSPQSGASGSGRRG